MEKKEENVQHNITSSRMKFAINEEKASNVHIRLGWGSFDCDVWCLLGAFGSAKWLQL